MQSKTNNYDTLVMIMIVAVIVAIVSVGLSG